MGGTRSKIAANTAIFSALDEYCSTRGEPIANAGKKRYIATSNAGQHFLINARLIELLSFSGTVKLARFDLDGRSYFFTLGMNTSEPPDLLDPLDLDGGLLTTLLAELVPTPIGSPFEIRNIVEFSDMSVDGYSGHDHVNVSCLYSKIQAFVVSDLPVENTFNVFFKLCLCDARQARRCIDDELAYTLEWMATRSPSFIPYRTLCRSMLDTDVSALFLALYRCLEALYAYTHTTDLMIKLGIDKPWAKMALVLEESLGWHPREEDSLRDLLAHAEDNDLQGVVAALNHGMPGKATLSAFVSKRVYHLRNSLVHYRPFYQGLTFPEVDWNRLCQSMALLVVHLYDNIYQDAGTSEDGDSTLANSFEPKEGGDDQ